MEPNRERLIEAAKRNRDELYRDYVRDEILIMKSEAFANVPGIQEADKRGVEDQIAKQKAHQRDLFHNITICEKLIDELSTEEKKSL